MSIREKEAIRIPIKEGQRILSLSWRGDELVDLAAGGTRYCLDGTIKSPGVYFAYRFDRAVLSPDGKYSVIYEVLGTKGLILRNNKPVREINRSFYHAHVYEYPLVIFQIQDGRMAIAHCPEEYNKIEIDEIESGQRLTTRGGQAADFFHSRLQASPDGEHLLSAGWIWHPLDAVQVFSIRDSLQNPTVLDKYARLELPAELFEVHSAAFQDNQTIIMVGDNGGEPGEGGQWLLQYDLRKAQVNSTIYLEETVGTIMPVNSEFIMGFYQHPKLIEIASGKVVQEWPDLNSGKQNSSIIPKTEKMPPLALDSKRMRFAVADPKGITVVQLG